MEEQWRDAQRRMDSKKTEHRRRLNTPALYAVEVYCQVFMLNGVTPDDFEDEDIRIRFKFLDYACVEIEKAPEDQQPGATSTTGTSSPWSSTPGTPGTPVGAAGYDTEPTLSSVPGKPGEDGKFGGITASMRSHLEGLKVGSNKEAAPGTATSGTATSGTASPGTASPSNTTPAASSTAAAPAAAEQPPQQALAPQQDNKVAGAEVQDGAPSSAPSVPEDSTVPPSEPASSPTQSSPSSSTKKNQLQRDPRYFNPRKLLKQNPPPPPVESQSGGDVAPTDQLTGADATTENGGTDEGSKTDLKTNSKKTTDLKSSSKTPPGSGKIADSSVGEGGQAVPESTVTDAPDDTTLPPTDQALTEYEEEYEEEESSIIDDRSNALYFENGKSLIFCTIPLNLLYSLPRYPLLVIFFKPPSEVLGIVRVDLSAFAEAVDSSIILTKSIPLSAERNGSFDIVSKGRNVGWADLSVRMSCFGPFLMHKIFVRDNPNEKQTPEARTRRTESNRLIVVQMSVSNLGLVRHKSKLFVSKSNPSLVGRVTRDISNLPPIVCADEHLICAPPRPKPELTIVEEEEIEKERKRRENLSRFPQYQCIDDWEVVFNRQVIKDLIAKNRRPFQPGSPDRIYVESYFPELLPEVSRRLKSMSKSGSESEKMQKGKKKPIKTHKKSSGDGPSLAYLELDETWLKDNHLQRIRRKSVRPAVRTSATEDEVVKSAPSGASSSPKLPTHTLPSMSHVAINHFDMEKNDYSADSRIFPHQLKSRSPSPSPERSPAPSGPGEYRADLKNASNVAVFHFDPNKKGAGHKQQRHPSLDATSSRQFKAGQAFNTRHPRVDSTLEKFNPIPGRPFAVEIRAPERSPTDKLVQAIRQIGDEVDGIGGDTKMLHSLYQDYISNEGSERFIPEHMKREKRTTQTPEETSRVLSGTVEPVLIEVDKGIPLAVPVRGTPYWEGHAPVCSEPTNCPHFIFLHPGFGYYGR